MSPSAVSPLLEEPAKASRLSRLRGRVAARDQPSPAADGMSVSPEAAIARSPWAAVKQVASRFVQALSPAFGALREQLQTPAEAESRGSGRQDTPRSQRRLFQVSIEPPSGQPAEGPLVTPPTVPLATRCGPPAWLEPPTVAALAKYLGGVDDAVDAVNATAAAVSERGLRVMCCRMAYAQGRADILEALS